MPKQIVVPKKISLKDHPEISEKHIQEEIAKDPSILGLGDLILKDKERIQPKAGRLDLLLQDPDYMRRYEVEIQLGKTDESHIIRTIEYWDIERKRYPQYEHCAVIVAEDITSRFLNVISLFNGSIPLIAIQLNAFETEDSIHLSFIKVMDQLSLGFADDDEEVSEVTDRTYWEKRATKSTVKIADELLGLVHDVNEEFELKYNKFYIGLAKGGRPNNFIYFKPKKKFITMIIRLPKEDKTDEEIENEGLDMMEYTRYGEYRINMRPGDVNKHKEFLLNLIKRAYEYDQNK